MDLTLQKEAVIMFWVMMEKSELFGVEIFRRKRRMISRVLVEMPFKPSTKDYPSFCIS